MDLVKIRIQFERSFFHLAAIVPVSGNWRSPPTESVIEVGGYSSKRPPASVARVKTAPALVHGANTTAMPFAGSRGCKPMRAMAKRLAIANREMRAASKQRRPRELSWVTALLY